MRGRLVILRDTGRGKVEGYALVQFGSGKESAVYVCLACIPREGDRTSPNIFPRGLRAEKPTQY